MARLFLGLELPAVIKNQLLALRSPLNGARWQNKDQLHLTLRFIGEVDPGTAKAIGNRLTNFSFPSFNVQVDGVGVFGDPERPRVLWAGLKDEGGMQALHDAIDALLTPLELHRDRHPFVPHITLARCRRDSAPAHYWLEQHADFALPPFSVTTVSLFESIRTYDAEHNETISAYQILKRSD